MYVWGGERYAVNMTNCYMIKGEGWQALRGALFRSLCVIKTGDAASTHTTLNFDLTHCWSREAKREGLGKARRVIHPSW